MSETKFPEELKQIEWFFENNESHTMSSNFLSMTERLMRGNSNISQTDRMGSYDHVAAVSMLKKTGKLRSIRKALVALPKNELEIILIYNSEEMNAVRKNGERLKLQKDHPRLVQLYHKYEKYLANPLSILDETLKLRGETKSANELLEQALYHYSIERQNEA